MREIIVGITLCLLSSLCLMFTLDIKDLQTDISDLRIEIEDITSHFEALEDYIAEMKLEMEK